jgi:hypothetical protein
MHYYFAQNDGKTFTQKNNNFLPCDGESLSEIGLDLTFCGTGLELRF